MNNIIDCIGQEINPGDVLLVPSKRARLFELFFVEKFTGESVVGFGEFDTKGYFSRSTAHEKCMRLTESQVKTHLATVPTHHYATTYVRVPATTVTGQSTWSYNKQTVSTERYAKLKQKLGL